MPIFDTYRKQAKLLLRWHRDGNYSVGEKVRRLARFATFSDRQILDMPFTLVMAQEVVAEEAGFADWAALKAASVDAEKTPRADPGPPVLAAVTPILMVSDVKRTAGYFEQKLGFAIDFLHGLPPFYGAVSRDGVCLHLRFVHAPNFAALSAQEHGLIVATIEVNNVWALFEEFNGRGADICYPLTREAWGGTDFHVRDPDGNAISFVTFGV